MTTHRTKAKSQVAKSKTTKPMPAGRQTKQARLIAMLRRPQGATIEQMAETLGWQPHTVRGTLSGALKKRLGLTVASTEEERGRVYRIAGGDGSKRP